MIAMRDAWILVTVFDDRSILVKKCKSYEAAHKEMVEELKSIVLDVLDFSDEQFYRMVDEPFGDEDWGCDQLFAWSYVGDVRDWRIVNLKTCIEVTG